MKKDRLGRLFDLDRQPVAGLNAEAAKKPRQTATGLFRLGVAVSATAPGLDEGQGAVGRKAALIELEQVARHGASGRARCLDLDEGNDALDVLGPGLIRHFPASLLVRRHGGSEPRRAAAGHYNTPCCARVIGAIARATKISLVPAPGALIRWEGVVTTERRLEAAAPDDPFLRRTIVPDLVAHEASQNLETHRGEGLEDFVTFIVED